MMRIAKKKEIWSSVTRLILVSATVYFILQPKLTLSETITKDHKILIKTFHNALLKSMISSKEVPIKNRYLKLKPIIYNTFHLKKMTAIASGPFWRSATKTQKQILLNEFSRLTIATYVSQFSSFSGEKFLITENFSGPQDTILIKTEIIRPKDTAIPLVYVLKEIKGKTGVIDILVDTGISEIAKKRSEYRTLLRTKGIIGLTEALRLKANELLSP